MQNKDILIDYIEFYGDAHGVMVIVVGNGHDHTSSNSWTRLIAFCLALISLGKV